MEQLPEVETARALMNEAMKWSVMKWLREKKSVRKTADQANAALDQLSESLKRHWPDSVRLAYEALRAEAASSKTAQHAQAKQPPANDSQASAIAKKVKQADDEAYRARMQAEETFDEAERVLSTILAREGCAQAIRAWDLQEKAIRKAEEVDHSFKA
jgi:IS30 family transposase